MPWVPCGGQFCEPQGGQCSLRFDPQQLPSASSSGLRCESMSWLNTSTVPSCSCTTRLWWAARFYLSINLRSIGSSNLHITAFTPNRSQLWESEMSVLWPLTASNLIKSSWHKLLQTHHVFPPATSRSYWHSQKMPLAQLMRGRCKISNKCSLTGQVKPRCWCLTIL